MVDTPLIVPDWPPDGRLAPPGLAWCVGPPTPCPRRAGFTVLPWAGLRERARRAAPSESRRSSLRSPWAPLLGPFRPGARIAVVGVAVGGLDDLRFLHDFVLAPARHGRCALLVAADAGPAAALTAGTAPDPGWRHPWTAERVRALLAGW
ncbi:hypothetical protein KDM41_10750, partial [bacterium]|nr:hypothetical protein [bacterium]